MSHNQSNRPVAVVCGVGEGIGQAVSEQFAQQGYVVALLARTQSKLDKIAGEMNSGGDGKTISAHAFATDLANEQSVNKTFAEIKNALGPVSVLIYNAGARRVNGKSVLDVTTDELHRFHSINFFGAFYATRCVLPDMLAAKQGTIIYTGATGSLRGAANLVSFSPGKFALRALAQTVTREYQQHGIHVIHTIIDGPVDGKLIGGVVRRRFQRAGEAEKLADISAVLMQPQDIAEQYWWLHKQPRSTWTHELDMRSYKETMFSKL